MKDQIEKDINKKVKILNIIYISIMVIGCMGFFIFFAIVFLGAAGML